MPLNQLLVGGVALLGIALGVLLRLLVPEEAAKGRAYFTMLERVLLAAAFVPAVALRVIARQWLVVAPLAVLLVVVLLLRFRWRIVLNAAVLAVLLVLTASDENLFLLEASLIFLYGLPAGTLAGTVGTQQRPPRAPAKAI